MSRQGLIQPFESHRKVYRDTIYLCCDTILNNYVSGREKHYHDNLFVCRDIGLLEHQIFCVTAYFLCVAT